MRSRKVRSFLSAYCNDELEGKRQDAVREHIAHDDSLQTEASAYSAIRQAAQELDEQKVSADFNNKLLNRIAEERFAETRTKAHLPRLTLPRPWWVKAVPAVVSAAVVLVVAVSMMGPDNDLFGPASASNSGNLDNRYLTAQPTANPNITHQLPSNWSLDRAIQRSQRINQLTSTMTANNGFIRRSHMPTGMQTVSVQRRDNSPFVTSYYEIRPVLKVYRVNNSQEDGSVY